MSAAVNVNRIDFVANAREAWGEALPVWVEILATEAARTSASAVAKRIGYSVTVVSMVIRANYAGDIGKIEAKVRGVYMGELVDCPVLGEIERDRCVNEQGHKFSATSALRTMLYRACRGACPHSRITKEAVDG